VNSLKTRDSVSRFIFQFIRGVSTNVEYRVSSNENASTTGLLDSLLSSLGEKFGLDNKWNLWENSLSEYLEVALLKQDVKIIRKIKVECFFII
jgi:hypothetical protein